MSITSPELYAEIYGLPLAVQTALQEVLTTPDRAAETLETLAAEVQSVAQRTAAHIGFLNDKIDVATARAQARDVTIMSAQASAEKRIRTAFGRIAAAGIGDDFNPRGYFVYCLWGKDETTPLYVGQSRNILSRLGQHMGNAKRRYHVRRVTLIRCKGAEAMEKTEARLIAEFQPPWNITGIADPAVRRSRMRRPTPRQILAEDENDHAPATLAEMPDAASA